MKKLLTTAAVALFALVGFGTTQTTHANSEIWDWYCNDTQAMKGTFVAITCKFTDSVNDYRYMADDEDASGLIEGFGQYEVTLPNTTLKQHHKYGLMMQKTEGGNQPNFRIYAYTNDDFWQEIDFCDLKDHDLHYGTFSPDLDLTSDTPTYIRGCFGFHLSGTEKIEAYIRDLEA